MDIVTSYINMRMCERCVDCVSANFSRLSVVESDVYIEAEGVRKGLIKLFRKNALVIPIAIGSYTKTTVTKCIRENVRDNPGVYIFLSDIESGSRNRRATYVGKSSSEEGLKKRLLEYANRDDPKIIDTEIILVCYYPLPSAMEEAFLSTHTFENNKKENYYFDNKFNKINIREQNKYLYYNIDEKRINIYI